MVKRAGLIVWVDSLRAVRHLKRYGNIHYVSRRLKYVVLYVDAEKLPQVMDQISKLRMVSKVERSYRHEIVIETRNEKADRTKEFDTRVGI